MKGYGSARIFFGEAGIALENASVDRPVDEFHFECPKCLRQSRLKCLDGHFSLSYVIEIIRWASPALKCKSTAAAARACGALTACITNELGSALAQACEFVLPMAAGPELSIPATKTFVASVTALARLVAFWAENTALASALGALPDRLAAASELDWSRLLDNFAVAESLVTIGRGPTLAIAREAALKLKETSDLHAEPFSAAEFLHGPIALVSPCYPVLMFAPTDAAAAGMTQLAADLTAKGAAAFITSSETSTPDRLPTLPPHHPETDAICLIQSFYAMVGRLAPLRGRNADRPRHLRKITRTR